MGLTLYNTLTGRKERFAPLDAGNVRMYVCGPTVYDDAHIGNARPIIVFDVFYRLLRHLYGPEHVTYARNITDVDDKINARAAEEKIAIGELTGRTTRRFHADVSAVGCLEPTIEPRATAHIAEMKALVECLVEKGHAYVAEDHVLFDVASDADYGALSRRSTDEMIAGARVEVAPYKKNPVDFVLWKPSGDGEPAWDSPCGIVAPGRPGWHLECSAMAAAHLGETFDIHGGGIDLVFPHHENEIAQSTCCHGTEAMARVWMHNGYLQVEGRKMAKSEGNFITMRELLTGWNGYAWPGEALRFNMLRTHYRQPLDWTFHSLDESHKILWDWYGRLKGETAAADTPGAVIAALCDDLNTPKAIAEMHKLANEGEYAALGAALNLLGFSGDRDRIVRSAVPAGEEAGAAHGAESISSGEIEELVAARAEARKAKNFAEADRIRDELAEKGIVLEDKPDGRTEWEIAR